MIRFILLYYLFPTILSFCGQKEVTYLDSFNAGYNIRTLDLYAAPIFKFHCNKGKSYQVAGHPESQTVLVPDEIVVVDNIDYREMSLRAMYSSYSAYMNEMTESKFFGLHIDVAIVGLGVDYRKEEYHMEQMIESQQCVVGHSVIDYNLFSVQMGSYKTLDKASQFKAYERLLPKTMPKKETDKDAIALTDFINHYGTHFIDSAEFGGSVHVNTAVAKSFYEEKKADFCKTGFQLYFRLYIFQIAGGLFNSKGDIKVDGEFQKAANTTIIYQGGKAEYKDKDHVLQWRDSIASNPEIYKGLSMNKISLLIDDPQKKKTLETAINNYIKKGTVTGKRGPKS